MTKQLRALIVEDSQSDALLLLRELRKAGYELQHQRVDNARDMQSALEKQTWDIILSDFSMPDFSATAALELVQGQQLDVPFIIVSGTMGEEAAVAAMKAGAHDYFPKGRIARLAVAIDREVREAEERRRRKEAEEELRQAEKRFTQAFQMNPGAIFISLRDNDVLWEINPRFLELLGHIREEVIGKSTFDLNIWFNPHERQRQIDELQPDEEGIRDIEMQVRSKNGNIHKVLVSCEAILLGQDHCVMTFMHDVTERKQAEDELRALYNATSVLFKADNLIDMGQQIVRAVVEEFDQFDCGLMMVDAKQGRLIRLARGGKQQVETDAPLYLEGQGLVPEVVRTEAMIYVPDVSADDRYVSNDPHTRSELVIPLKTAKGVVGTLDLQSIQIDAFSKRDRRILSTFAERAALAIELMALYEDVNRHANELEQRVAQRTLELRHAKERVEAILNNSSDAIALLDGNGIIQQINPAFHDLFGNSLTVHDSLLQIGNKMQSEKLKNAIESVIRNKQSDRLELHIQDKNQNDLDVDLAIAPVTHDTTQDTYVICSFRDISERKQLEENLRQTLAKERELSELKSRFTSMVSHEFRTPLAVIQASTDTLKHYMARLSEEKKTEYLDKIQGQIKRLVNMMDDVLALGKAQAVGIQFTAIPLNLETLCHEVVAEIQTTTTEHLIQVSVTGECTEILADGNLLRQMLTNLLSNAVKYSPQGSDIACNLICSDTQVVLSVKDNGIGIPESDLGLLFEDFHRAKNVADIQGTGLGLSIVKQAVEAHGGSIQVESQVGIGTVFTITFPPNGEMNSDRYDS